MSLSKIDEHPSTEALLRERLKSSGYNVLKENVSPSIFESIEKFEGLLSGPFEDEDPVASAKALSVAVLADLVRVHYELQSKLDAKSAAKVAELADLALLLTQKIHDFADQT